MNRLFITFILLFIPSLGIGSTIQFSADHLMVTFPDTISASGNTFFSNKNMSISSDSFVYGTRHSTAQFDDNVVLTHRNVTLSGQSFSLDIPKQTLVGHTNIVFQSPTLHAVSDDIWIDNYNVATLKNNVFIRQDDQFIQSNELVYHVKTDTILSNERVKLRLLIEEP